MHPLNEIPLDTLATIVLRVCEAKEARTMEQAYQEVTRRFAKGESMRDAFNDVTTGEWWKWERCQALAARLGMRIG
jgi:hypothetical protein